MTEYSTGTSEPPLAKRSASGWISIPSAGNGWNFIPLAPGLFGGYLAYSLYPFLDGRYVLIGVVFLFFLSAALVPRAAAYSGLALALLAAMLFLNGALDRSPPAEIKTTVIGKAMVTGRVKRGTYYHVVVSSWRPGRSQEDFEVDSDIYRRAAIGRPATVELHKGCFGLPWYGSISPE
jgi:hypothetical protein